LAKNPYFFTHPSEVLRYFFPVFAAHFSQNPSAHFVNVENGAKNGAFLHIEPQMKKKYLILARSTPLILWMTYVPSLFLNLSFMPYAMPYAMPFSSISVRLHWYPAQYVIMIVCFHMSFVVICMPISKQHICE
jgi:hypothetical protein